jgi:hypothetical protein
MKQVCLAVYRLVLLFVVATPALCDGAALRVAGKALGIVELESLFGKASIGACRPFTSSPAAEANAHFLGRMQKVNSLRLQQTKFITTPTFVDAVYSCDLHTMRIFLADRLRRMDKDAHCFFNEMERNAWWDEALATAAINERLDAINLLLAFRKIVCERVVDNELLVERASVCLDLEVLASACKKQECPLRMGTSVEQYYKEQLGEIAKNMKFLGRQDVMDCYEKPLTCLKSDDHSDFARCLALGRCCFNAPIKE